jgi:hypothetical protein
MNASITSDPGMMQGKPVVAGTRITRWSTSPRRCGRRPTSRYAGHEGLRGGGGAARDHTPPPPHPLATEGLRRRTPPTPRTPSTRTSASSCAGPSAAATPRTPPRPRRTSTSDGPRSGRSGGTGSCRTRRRSRPSSRRLSESVGPGSGARGHGVYCATSSAACGSFGHPRLPLLQVRLTPPSPPSGVCGWTAFVPRPG